MAAAADPEPCERPVKAGALQEGDASAKQASSQTSWVFWWASGIMICAMLCLGVALYYNWEHLVASLFSMLEANKDQHVLQALVINAMLVVLVVCCLPGPGLCMIMDGFFFGFWEGWALGFVAEYTAYFISIVLARTWLRARMREWMAAYSTLNEIVLICEEDASGKFLVLMRFLAIPIWVKNYSMGVMELTWLKIVLAFIPAGLLWSAKFAYIGSKSYQMADALRRGNQGRVMDQFSGMEVVVVAISATVMLLLTVLGWYEYGARRAAIDTGETKPLNVA